MSEVDLSKKKEQTKQAPTTEEDSKLVKQQQEDIMAPNSGEVVGEVGDDDFKLPTMHITQKIGPLSEMFNPGEIVLNKEVPLINGDTKQEKNKDNFLELTVLRIQKKYEEKLDYNDDEIPRIVTSLQEVYNLGGEVAWEKDANGKTIEPTWQPIATLLALIKDPTGEDDLNFPFEYDGNKYTVVTWTVRGGAYRSAAQEVFTAEKFYYRQGLRTGSFKLTCPFYKYPNGNSSYLATLRKHSKNSKEFTDWLNDFGL